MFAGRCTGVTKASRLRGCMKILACAKNDFRVRRCVRTGHICTCVHLAYIFRSRAQIFRFPNSYFGCNGGVVAISSGVSLRRPCPRRWLGSRRRIAHFVSRMSEVTFLEVGLPSQEVRETMRRDGDHGNKVGVEASGWWVL